MRSKIEVLSRWLTLVAFVVSGASMAATLDVLVDRDNNTATGCTVNTPGGAFAGVEQVFTTSVNTSVFPAKVAGITRQDCLTPPSTFSAPIAVDPGGWPIGVGIGTNGFDVVESYFTISQQFGQYRLGFVYTDPNSGQDALLNVNGQAGGAPIVAIIGPTPIIPTLTHGALLFLAFALGWFALWQMRRHKASTLIVVGVLATIVGGTALAAVVLDGMISDWQGVPPIATDPIGDAPAGADITAAFIQIDAGRVYVRVDVKIATPPSITSANYATLSVGAAGSFTFTTFAIPLVNAITQTGALPNGVNFVYTAGQSTATLAGTPAANTGGVYPLMLTAKNGVSPDATQAFTLTVNQAPAITSPNSKTCVIGVVCTFTVSATGYPVPAIARAGALPSGMNYADNGNGTGTLSGVPNLGAVGAYPISFTASNGIGSNDVQSFGLTVVKASTTTTIVSAINPSLVSQTVTFTATVQPQENGTPGGQVQFKDGGANLGAPVVLDASGKATLSSSALALGSHVITVDYPGDPNFTASSGSLPTQTVTKASSATAVTSSVNPSVFGQPVTLTATVTATPPAGGTPGGAVQFKDGGTNLGAPVAVNAGGVATLSTSSLAAGGHPITADYSGDANFAISTGALAGGQTVNKAGTSAAVTPSVNPTVFGQGTTLTVTVTAGAPGAGTPSGSVQFRDGAGNIGAPVALNAGGVATLIVANLTVGAHQITAQYAGDGNFNGNTSPPLAQVVNKASTATAVTSSGNPSVFGQNVIFTASMTATAPGGGTPTGTVQFKDGAANLGAPMTVDGTGKATLSIASLTVGAHSITADYSGDANFNGSSGSLPTQTVNKANSAVALASSANPSVIGQSVTFTATVTAVVPGAGVPSGFVQFKDGAANLGGAVALDGTGKATLSTGALGLGGHTISADYSSDGNFNAGSGGPLAQTVNKADSSTAVTSSVNPSVFGQSTTFTATVTPVAPGSGTPTGTVQFKDGVANVGAPVPLVGGAATLATGALTTGAHAITAVYGGDGTFNTSTGTLVGGQTANKSATSTTVGSTINPTAYGQTTQLSATVSASGGGAGTPTGTVQFMDGASLIGAPANLNGGGVATLTVSTLTAGAHAITAQYNGDGNFNTSTGSLPTQNINKAGTTTQVVSNLNPSPKNSSVTFTATVTPAFTGSPTGTVTFLDGATPIGNANLVAGVAQLSTASLAPGMHSITASYPGDGNFNGSASGALAQVVTDLPAAVNDSTYTTVHDTNLPVAAPGVLANDALGTPPAGISKVGATVCAFPAACVSATTVGGSVSLLANGSFTFTPKANFSGNDTFTYTLDNGAGTSTATVTINVINIAPVADLNGPLAGINFGPVTYNENSGDVAIVGITVGTDQLTVADSDAVSGNLASATVTLTNVMDTGEVLTLTCGPCGAIAQADIVVSTTPTTYTLTVTKNAPIADYQTMLRTLTYRNPSLNPTTAADATKDRVITVTVNDGIAASSPVAQSTVHIIAVNNAPTLAAIEPAALSYKAGSPAIALTATLTVSDPDSANLSGATVRITNNCVPADDVLSLPAQPGITGNYVANPNCVLTLTGAATLAAYQTALRAVTYRNTNNGTPNNTRTVTFQISDDQSTPSNIVTRGIGVSTNAAPVLTAGGTLSYTEKQAATAIDTTVTVTDSDSPNLVGATITITAGCTASEDVLSFANTATITGTPGSCSMTLAGSDTVANYQTALRNVKYSNTSNNPSAVSRTVTWQVDDGAVANNLSNTPTSTINITTVNDPPTFTKGADQTVLEDAGAQTVSGWATAINPIESGQTVTFQVTGNTNAGLFSAGPAISPTGVLTFTPAANANGAATITIVLKDNGGTANGGNDTSASQSFNINVTAVNDRPTFTKGPDQTVLEDSGAQTANPWATALSAGPADEAGQTLTFQVTGNTTPSLFAAGPAINATGVLTYTPAANANGSATITIVLKDNGGTANGGFDTSLPQSFLITVSAVNDPPVAQNKGPLPVQANMKVVGLDAGLLIGVTDADSGVNGCNPTFSVASITAVNGGSVSNVNPAAGTFDFDPNPGFTGAASVNYTVSDNGCPGVATSAAATITLNVSGPVIWFVDPSVAGPGDGRLSNPFKSLSSVSGVDAAGHGVFVYAGTQSSGFTLKSSESLIGQGVSTTSDAAFTSFDVVFGISPPAGTLARPSIAGTRPILQNTVTLNANSTVRGLNIQSAANTGMADPAAAITGVSVSEVAVTTTTGTSVLLSNIGGTLTFDGLTTSSATGADLTGSNALGTFNFSGIGIASGSSTGFNATGGGTVNVTGAANVISSTSGIALNIVNTTIGASGLTFRSISSSAGANNGIILDTTGASGGLSVTGNGTPASGGTISGKTGADASTTSGICIYLNSTRNVSLARMDIEGCQNYGIRGFTVSGFTLDSSTVGTTAVHGTSQSADVDAGTLFSGEGSIRFNDLTGTVAITNSTLDGGFSRTIAIHNYSGSLTATIDNSTLRNTSTNAATTDAVFMQSSNAATMNLTVTNNSQFTAYRQFAIQTDARDTSTMAINIDGSTFANSNAAPINAAGSLSLGTSASTDTLVSFNIHNNTFRHGVLGSGSAPSNGGAHLVAGTVSGAGKFDGKFVNNTVGVAGVPFSGAGNGADALRLFTSGNKAGTTRVTGTTDTRYLVQGNTIKRYGEVGIQFNARQGNSTLDATVLGNTIDTPGTAAAGAFAAIWVNAGALVADTNTVNIAIGDKNVAANKNTMQDSDPNNATDVFLDKNSCGGCGSTLNLYRNGSVAAGAGEALIQAILIDDNNPTLDLGAGFTNGSTIGTPAGLPPQPL